MKRVSLPRVPAESHTKEAGAFGAARRLGARLATAGRGGLRRADNTFAGTPGRAAATAGVLGAGAGIGAGLAVGGGSVPAKVRSSRVFQTLFQRTKARFPDVPDSVIEKLIYQALKEKGALEKLSAEKDKKTGLKSHDFKDKADPARRFLALGAPLALMGFGGLGGALHARSAAKNPRDRRRIFWRGFGGSAAGALGAGLPAAILINHAYTRGLGKRVGRGAIDYLDEVSRLQRAKALSRAAAIGGSLTGGMIGVRSATKGMKPGDFHPSEEAVRRMRRRD